MKLMYRIHNTHNPISALVPNKSPQPRLHIHVRPISHTSYIAAAVRGELVKQRKTARGSRVVKFAYRIASRVARSHRCRLHLHSRERARILWREDAYTARGERELTK